MKSKESSRVLKDAIIDVPGIKVGHNQDSKAGTGCTVIICEKGATTGVDVRGGAPGPRETDLFPCNTARYFLSQIQKSVKIPILNMIEETAKETKKRIPQIKKVGLLTSMGVYKSKIYHQHFKKFNIEVISPEEKGKEEVMKAIYTVKAGDLSEKIGKNIFKIAQKLIDKGAKAIIAGCTEIPLILKEAFL